MPKKNGFIILDNIPQAHPIIARPKIINGIFIAAM